ncbi:PAS domain-containing protein [Azospirillum sp. TSO5]|uniref:PAS domain-containing protein n=1 Tax=Azospirillum sp. TSO5 TaxID=716760 RepID=UPI000D615547|nr:PAS domain-containing protein [Azospirillum sp. TSO5]PWC92885.1 chemotaxis protein [Azospirillum sp. TSO5]
MALYDTVSGEGGGTRSLTRVERFFPDDEIIVSKTDPKGRLVYVNDIFLSVSGYTERELIGQPHSVIRHPEMPRCVFRLMWERIGSGQEIFAYVNNRAKNGDHYWVFAHVTPSYEGPGRLVGYHSNRRVPRREAIEKIKPIYGALLSEENRHADRKAGLDASCRLLNDHLVSLGKSYDQFVHEL